MTKKHTDWSKLAHEVDPVKAKEIAENMGIVAQKAKSEDVPFHKFHQAMTWLDENLPGEYLADFRDMRDQWKAENWEEIKAKIPPEAIRIDEDGTERFELGAFAKAIGRPEAALLRNIGLPSGPDAKPVKKFPETKPAFNPDGTPHMVDGDQVQLLNDRATLLMVLHWYATEPNEKTLQSFHRWQAAAKQNGCSDILIQRAIDALKDDHTVLANSYLDQIDQRYLSDINGLRAMGFNFIQADEFN